MSNNNKVLTENDKLLIELMNKEVEARSDFEIVFLVNDEQKPFEPKFKGYMKLFLHDDKPDELHKRASFTDKWLPSRRRKIIKKDRIFSIRLHIFDKQGVKQGHAVINLMGAGEMKDVSKAIVVGGNTYIDKLRVDFKKDTGNELQVDLVNSYAVVRA